MITPDLLHQIMPFAGLKADLYAKHLESACESHEIGTPRRISAFLAQIAHESAELRHARELWGPTPAQQAYEGRRDLGNIAIGDGHFYLGRGLIQLTGRTNYQKAQEALGIDCVVHPEILETPEWASKSAAWFWQTHGLNELADAGRLRAITRRINGGLNGWEDRLQYYSRACSALGIEATVSD